MSTHWVPGSVWHACPARGTSMSGEQQHRILKSVPPAQFTFACGLPMLPVMAASWMSARIGRWPFQ